MGFPFIKNLHGDKGSAYAKYMGDAIFRIPIPLMLDKVVAFLDEIYDQMARLKQADTRGMCMSTCFPSLPLPG